MSKNLSIEKVDEILLRDRFTCAYCGFRGDSFEKWMLLSIDHIIPRYIKEDNSDKNLTVACLSCNSITNKAEVLPDEGRKQIIEKKRKIVMEHRITVFDRWFNNIKKCII